MKTYVIKYGKVFVGDYYLGEEYQQSVSYRWIDEKIKPMEFTDKATAQEIADKLNDIFYRPYFNRLRKKHKVILKETALRKQEFCSKRVAR